jgi:hypothetical protein
VRLNVDRNKIEQYVRSIDSVRNEVSFHIVITLRKASREYHAETSQRLDMLRDDVQAILRLFESDPKDQTPAFNELAETIRSSSTLSKQPADHARMALGSTPRSSPLFLPDADELDLLDDLNIEPPTEAIKSRARQRTAFLDYMLFPAMKSRLQDIDHAYDHTFQWIFDEKSQNLAWDSFVKFLKDENVTRPYWVSGKAGSGKSTLMKYISHHPAVDHFLRIWAGDGYISAQFFAWNLGTPMQKSQLGLLRSLLHQILSARPSLIHQTFPELWRKFRNAEPIQPISLSEIKMGFQQLIGLSNLPCKIYIFIDGVDEFEDSDQELCHFFRNLASANVKAILSSRPEI